jgi:hypothetical protein
MSRRQQRAGATEKRNEIMGTRHRLRMLKRMRDVAKDLLGIINLEICAERDGRDRWNSGGDQVRMLIHVMIEEL